MCLHWPFITDCSRLFSYISAHSLRQGDEHPTLHSSWGMACFPFTAYTDVFALVDDIWRSSLSLPVIMSVLMLQMSRLQCQALMSLLSSQSELCGCVVSVGSARGVNIRAQLLHAPVYWYWKIGRDSPIHLFIAWCAWLL